MAAPASAPPDDSTPQQLVALGNRGRYSASENTHGAALVGVFLFGRLFVQVHGQYFAAGAKCGNAIDFLTFYKGLW